MFQFTHPGRGATGLGSPRAECSGVSIHAPREGCDCTFVVITLVEVSFNSRTPGGVRLEEASRRLVDIKFQFTHPGRGATPAVGANVVNEMVSIHAPREGCDRRWTIQVPPGAVSIHAPREGCDVLSLPSLCTPFGFNSRTPGGVRPQSHSRAYLRDEFQFTHPGRGATGRRGQGRDEDHVSIHAPREGCD